jgi:acyl-homoserine lactone acylase PvdQ
VQIVQDQTAVTNVDVSSAVPFPGFSGVVLACEQTIGWGSTVNVCDTTDVYQEEVRRIRSSRSFVHRCTYSDTIREW